LWLRHREEFGVLRDRQAAERQAERDAQTVKRKGISFAHAKAVLSKERETAAPQEPQRPIRRAPGQLSLDKAFDKAASGEPPAKISRADEIRREMEEWRRKNPDKDFGREM
jgi:hypothetical protein